MAWTRIFLAAAGLLAVLYMAHAFAEVLVPVLQGAIAVLGALVFVIVAWVLEAVNSLRNSSALEQAIVALAIMLFVIIVQLSRLRAHVERLELTVLIIVRRLADTAQAERAGDDPERSPQIEFRLHN